MAATDLLFSQLPNPPGGPVEIVFGDDSGTPAGAVELLASGTITGLRGSIIARVATRLGAAGTITGLRGSVVATKVRATLVDARDVMSNAFDVVVERGDVYLMGMVTEREANRVAELVSTISGVRRVVKVFQIISEDELARKLPRPASPAASESSTQP